MAGANRRDIQQYTDSLARYLPGGRLFEAAHIDGTNLRSLIEGFSMELFRVNGLIKEYCEEILPDETVKFISEWESAVGIPDDCFLGTGTIDERRTDVIVKLASAGIQTNQDFIDLAATFGVTVIVQNGTEHGVLPLTLPFILFSDRKEVRNTIFVTFTAGTPEQIAILECLFNKLKPATAIVIFQMI